MNKLPAETISHIMHLLGDTAAVKLARLTCKAICNAYPIEKLIGVDRETAQWLLSPVQPQRWLKPDMRQLDFTVCVHDRVITMYTHFDHERIKSESHQPLSKKYVFPSIEEHRCIITIKANVCTLSIMHNMDEDENEVIISDNGDSVCAFCEQPGLLYMTTHDGAIFCLVLDQSMAGICSDFVQKQAQVYKRIDFQPVFARFGHSIAINKFATIDGETFVYLINSNTIATFKPHAAPAFTTSPETILDFWIINDDAIVCWMESGVLRLLFGNRFVAAASVAVQNTAVIHITPSLRSVWLLDTSKRLFRTGANLEIGKHFSAARPTRSIALKKKVAKLHIKLKEARAANTLLALKLECVQTQYNTLRSRLTPE